MKPTNPINDIKNEGKDLSMTSAKGYLKDMASAKDHLKEMESVQVEQLKYTGTDLKKLLISSFSSFNLYPDTSLTSLLNTIHYAASSSEAINKDWQNVGNDLWQSWAAIKDEHE